MFKKIFITILILLNCHPVFAGAGAQDSLASYGITGTIADFNTAITDGDVATGGGTATGTNTGDNATNSQYSSLVTNATHTGDATGATALSVVKIQGKDFPTLGVGDDTKYPKYNNATNAFVMTAIAGGGDMVLADAQTVTGVKTFNDTKLLLRNVANTFNGSFVNTNTADRIYTLKDAAGTLAFTSDITGTNSGTNTGDNTVATTGDSATSFFPSGAVEVAVGGTGVSTLADAGVLIGNGTGAVQVTTAGSSGQVLTSNGAGVDPTFQNAAGGSTPAWKGNIAAAWGDGNPAIALQFMTSAGVISPTPTNITTLVARCAFFKLDTALVLNKFRFYGVGNTTGIYRVAIYPATVGASKLTGVNDFNTAISAWGSAGSALNITLAANTLYVIAVAVDSTGTTAGILSLGATTNVTTGMTPLPTGWPGNLDIDMASAKIDPIGYAQFGVTSGALPATLPTLVNTTVWTGGVPAFFLDNNNS